MLEKETALDDVDKARFLTVDLMVENTRSNLIGAGQRPRITKEDCAIYHLVVASMRPSFVARDLVGFSMETISKMDDPFPLDAIRWTADDVIERAIPMLRKIAGTNPPRGIKCNGPGCGYGGIKTYECENCGSLCCYCFGADDERFEWCDDCAAEATNDEATATDGAQAESSPGP
jgi:hypothetical protein